MEDMLEMWLFFGSVGVGLTALAGVAYAVAGGRLMREKERSE